jgi:hypothetical protein
VKTPAQIDVHLNDLDGGSIGVANLGSGAINAMMNWWGCSGARLFERTGHRNYLRTLADEAGQSI